jgi:hypothetical protein
MPWLRFCKYSRPPGLCHSLKPLVRQFVKLYGQPRRRGLMLGLQPSLTHVEALFGALFDIHKTLITPFVRPSKFVAAMPFGSESLFVWCSHFSGYGFQLRLFESFIKPFYSHLSSAFRATFKHRSHLNIQRSSQ